MKKVRFPRSVIIVIAVYLVAAISASITMQNWDFLKIYIPFYILTAIIIAMMHKRVNFSTAVLWFLTIWGAMHLAGGLVRIPDGWDFQGDKQVLYSWWVIGQWLKWDHIVHAFGFGTCTWLTWEALRASIQYRLGRKLYPSFGMILLCVFSGMGLGAANEIIEYIVRPGISQTAVTLYVGTCRDLIANSVGCLFVGILILFRG